MANPFDFSSRTYDARRRRQTQESLCHGAAQEGRVQGNEGSRQGLQHEHTDSCTRVAGATGPSRRQGRRRKAKPSVAAPLPLGRALSLLCAASGLAGQTFFSPIQQASALAVPQNGHLGQDAPTTAFAAGFAGQSNGEQSSKFQHHYVGVGSLPSSNVSSSPQDDDDKNNLSGSKAIAGTVIGKARKNETAVFEVVTVNATSEKLQVSDAIGQAASGRWGQSASYLPAQQAIFFIGGQVSNGSSRALTNDVFALNISSIATNSTSGPLNPWQSIASQGLPAHAFASHVVVSANGTDQVWLMGGQTSGCSDAPVWTWSPSGENGLNSAWVAMNVSAGPQPARRAGASAIEVPAANDSSTEASFLLLGGTDASTQCSSPTQAQRRQDSAADVTADVWTLPKSLTPADGRNGSTSALSVQSMAVDDGHGDFSMVDYSTVRMPGSGSVGASEGPTLFLGGLTASSEFASFSVLWAYDPWIGSWFQLAAEGDVPEGRRGHSTTRLKDGRIALFGGMLASGDIASDVYVLDPAQEPAEWTKASFAEDGSVHAPAKAYHSAVLVGDVLVMGFGAGDSAASTSAPTSSLYYLDTAEDGRWRWSDSIEGVLTGRGVLAASPQRQAVANTGDDDSNDSTGAKTSSAAPEGDASDTATDASATVSSPAAAQDGHGAAADTSSHSAHSSDDGASSIGTTSNAPGSIAGGSPGSVSAGNTDSSSNTKTDNGNNSQGKGSLNPAAKTGAIAGSLLGAAALAAVCGGLYAYKKRKDAHELGAVQSDMVARNIGRQGNSGPSLPPVSALWFNNVRRKGDEENDASLTQSPNVGAFAARKMASRKSAGLRESSWAPSFMQTADDLVAPDLMNSAVRSSALYDDTYLSLDHTPALGAVDRNTHLGVPVSSYPRFGGSSDSLANDVSDGEASHFSYPYLSGMHRGGDAFSPSIMSYQGTPASAFMPTGTFCSPEMPTERGSPLASIAEQRRFSAPVTAFAGRQNIGTRAASAGRVSNQALSSTWHPEAVEERNAILDSISPFDDAFVGVGISTLEEEEEEESTESEDIRTDVAMQGSSADSEMTSSADHNVNLSSVLAGDAIPRQQQRRVFSDGAATIRHSGSMAEQMLASASMERNESRLHSAQRAKRSQLRVVNPESGVESDA